MSPEAIELPEGMRRLKVGRPSDVWSLGCILYQMVYGQPPFHHLSVFQKMKAIPDLEHIIEFPETSVPMVSVPKASNGIDGTTPSPPSPTRLEHLARPVRRDVVSTMQRCLVRNPKERATIPELLEDDWLAMKEPPPPPPSPPPRDPTPSPPPPQTPSPAPRELLLNEDETIINAHYMRQLLQYAVDLAKSGQTLSEEKQVEQAKVSFADLLCLNGIGESVD